MGDIVRTAGMGRDYTVGGSLVRALDSVSLAVPAGQFVAVMGPSGSGKSTFMNLVGCLDTPTRGQYALDGEQVAGLDSDRLAALRNRKLGFVFQSFNLLPRATALQNVGLPMAYRGVTGRAREVAAARVLERVGLADRTHHTPTQLSGGQQQRVAIARALVNDPVLILADEPTGALDSHTSLEIMALFQALNAEGRTIVVVTHEPDVAAFATRVVRFRDGNVVSDRNQTPKSATAALLADRNPHPAAEQIAREQAA